VHQRNSREGIAVLLTEVTKISIGKINESNDFNETEDVDGGLEEKEKYTGLVVNFQRMPQANTFI